MSRIGKQPITIPNDIVASLEERRVVVRGPKGEVVVPLHPHVTVRESAGALAVSVARTEHRGDRALWGLTARLIRNAVVGVTEGFERKLEVHGVGYRVGAGEGALELRLGFSHPVHFTLPNGITAVVEKNVITLRGVDRQLVGETAARLRSVRKPDAYHGKGIRYAGEVIKLKPGKAAKGATSS